MNWIGQNLAAAFLAFSLRNELATVVAFASPLHHTHAVQMSIVIVQVTCSSSTVSSERRFDKGLTIATLKVCDRARLYLIVARPSC